MCKCAADVAYWSLVTRGPMGHNGVLMQVVHMAHMGQLIQVVRMVHMGQLMQVVRMVHMGQLVQVVRMVHMGKLIQVEQWCIWVSSCRRWTWRIRFS